MGLMGGGGWLGGHLSYAQGVGVDQTIFDPGEEDWTVTDIAADDLADGKATCAVAGETPVMLYRTNGTIRALHNRCAHRGGPLSDGEIDGDTVTCPWHNDGVLARGRLRRRRPERLPAAGVRGA